ncbi:phage tail protein [Methylobacterium sp. NMS14P]|uniref:phage tail tube protein n=1 Tax=Methylobacterium sp. NMS14P TaxID=2894310 RepID=UPI0023586CA8|nr:phage tail tube protein [Methylobacterium sp. NMS14P]WCS27789.1 phage tail protein [Methylobacterium sp. NMS14P]
MFADGSGVRVAYVPETDFGVTPATPAFKTARVTSGGLRTNKTTVTSDERQADRNVRDEILTGLAAGGSYNFEFSSGDFIEMLLANALRGAWATDVLKNGVLAPTLTIEETLELGATDSFSRFPGSTVNTLSLSIGAREKITGSVAFMCQKEVLATSIITGATYTAPSVDPIANASNNVAALTVGTINPAPRVKTLTMEINNGLRERPEVGSLYSNQFGADRCNITGTLNAYFESNALYQAVLDHGSAALSFTLGVESGKRYTFLFPKIRFGDGERAVGGNTDDVMVNIPFRALYDPTEACTLKITRNVT